LLQHEEIDAAPARSPLESSTAQLKRSDRATDTTHVATVTRAPTRLSWAERLFGRSRAGVLVAEGSTLRAQVSARQNAGRAVIVWATAYLSLRPWATIDHAVVLALFVTGSWTLIGHRVAQAFRSMTFAVGPFAVSAVTSIIGVGVMSALGYWLPHWAVGQRALALVGITTFAGVGMWDAIVQRAARAPRRVLVVGGGAPTTRLLADLAREPEAGLHVIGVVDDSFDEVLSASVPYWGPLHALPSSVRRLAPDLVVVAVPKGRPEVFAQLLGVADAGFQVVGLPEIYEFAFGRLPVEDLTSAWFMSVLHAYNRPTNRLTKRTFDVVVAFVGLLVTLVVLPAIALLVKRTRGPLLYRQERLGENGETFTILKFRSMRVDAEAPGEAQWAATNDPRVIPGGRLLRLLRIDELPQLWNVLRGEMSIVGPRPERPEFISQLQAGVPFWTHRHLLKPGITGWAQIRAGYAADALGTIEKLSYDLWYLRHRSLVLDVMICLKTLPRMATFRGAR
jgi:exopolysaccharide biosynthesis polyprenyl glycosylphosphotransferase